MDREALITRLGAVVRRHIPSPNRDAILWLGEAEHPRWSWEHLLADGLIEASEFAWDRWGVSPDKEKLERLNRALVETRGILNQLAQDTLLDMGQASRLCAQTEPKHLAQELDGIAAEALRVVQILRSFPNYKKPSSSKVNWRAASVAARCREIWSVYQNGGHFPLPDILIPIGSHQGNLQSWDSMNAPKVVHNDRPSKMGLFIEDVFEALGILGKEGEPVRAASALRSADRLIRKQ